MLQRYFRAPCWRDFHHCVYNTIRLWSHLNPPPLAVFKTRGHEYATILHVFRVREPDETLLVSMLPWISFWPTNIERPSMDEEFLAELMRTAIPERPEDCDTSTSVPLILY